MDDDIFSVSSLSLLKFFFSLMSIISVAMVLSSHVSLFFRCGSVAFILLSLLFLWCKPGLVIFSISHVEKTEWLLIGFEHSVVVRICSNSVVTRYMSILYFVDAGRRKHVVMLFGGLFESYYQRRLRFIVRTQ